jgi:hypothetical protein
MATRMYVPVVGHPPACRRCFGLSYESRTANYKATGLAADWGPMAYQTTNARRDERHQAARARCELRRPFLAASLANPVSSTLTAAPQQEALNPVVEDATLSYLFPHEDSWMS